MKKIFSDIRVWIFIFFLIRLIGITNPPIEIAHVWRQVTGDMVARNFYEVDNNIMYPRFDMAGNKTGITGTEFPILNYLVYLVSLVFGFNDWYGRLINLIVSSIGIYFLYKLLKLKFKEEHAFVTSILLLVSMWFMYSRKVMPDTFSTSLVIIALCNAFLYCINKQKKHLLIYILFASLGVLSKIPSAYLLVTLVFIFQDPKVNLYQKIEIFLASVLVAIPVVFWYFYWFPFLNSQYGFPYYSMGTSFSNGFIQIISNLDQTLEKFYFEPVKFSGFALFLFGIYTAIKSKNKAVTYLFLGCFSAFSVFIFKAGLNFSHHSYYVIPFVPVICFVTAFGITSIPKKWLQVVFVLIISTECIANQQHDFFIKDSQRYKLNLENIADKVSCKNDLIAINGGTNPQQLYFTHRKGWSYDEFQINNPDILNDLKRSGCKYIFIDKGQANIDNVLKFGEQVYNGEYYLVLKMK